MNLLALVQQAYMEMGLNAPSQVVGSTDPQVLQMYSLLNRHGHDLSRTYEWEKLNKEYILTTVSYNLTGTTTLDSRVVTGIASTALLSTNFGMMGDGIMPFATISSVDSATQVTMNQPATASGTVTLQFSQVSYPLPADWLKQIPQTEWDRTNRWPLMGPKSPQEWQAYKSGIVYAGPRERFRIQAGAVQINPPPPNALTFSYEYISSYWALSAAGVSKYQFTVDTDTCIFDDSLMVAGLKLRFKQAKGLDFTFESSEYQGLLQMIKAQDQSAPTLSLSPEYGSILLSYDNVPDGNWPG